MRTSLKTILARLAILPVVWVVNFSLLYFSPGDVTNRYWSPQTSQSALAEMRAAKGLDLSYPEQLFFWTKRLLQGDFGYSWIYHRPVTAVFGEALPATLQLTLTALLLNIIIGCFFGILSAVYAHQRLGRLLDQIGQIVYAAPVFLLAMVLIYVFSLKLNWLPVAGMQSLFPAGDSAWDVWLDRLRHLVLPVAVLGVAGAIPMMRYVAGRMKEILRQPYILLARAKGLSSRRTLLVHAFRNALLPVVTQIGLALPFLFSGALVVEVIFAWPGMGRAIYEAIFARDYPIILAANFVIAVLVILGNLAADAAYSLIDPRIRR